MRNWNWNWLAATAMALALSACGSAPAAAPETSPVTGAPSSVESTESPEPASAAPYLAELEKLPVKGRAPKTGYSREQFGPAWSDVDHNDCDTRNDVLKRDLTNEAFKPGTHDCVVLAGTLRDPYTGKTILFSRGACLADHPAPCSNDVQIDHLVSLSNAWQTGAQQLDAQTREQFANDPDNLTAVDGPTNQAKGDGDFATWKPPNRDYWCTYASRQVAVKAMYHLWVTQAEHDAMTRTLNDCPAG